MSFIWLVRVVDAMVMMLCARGGVRGFPKMKHSAVLGTCFISVDF